MSNTSYSFKENSHVIDNQGGEKKVMKKILSVALSTAMAFSMFASVAFGADAKLTPQQQFDALKQAGIVTGMPDGSSALEKTLTRAELAKIIVKSIGLEEVNATSYNDKNYANHWARTFIEAATQAGILEGTDATKKLFNPSGNVTVQELAAVLVRALKLEVPTDTNNSASAWAKGYVQAAVDAGFIDASANFTATATRSQAIVAAYAIYEAAQVPTVKSYEVKDSKNVEFTLSNDEVVKVTLEKALEANKETEVTFKTAAGEEITAKVTWVVTTATKVDKVEATNLKEVTVAFDGTVDKETAEDASNYSLKSGKAIEKAVLSSDEKTVTLTVVNTLTNNKADFLTVSNVKAGDKVVSAKEVSFTTIDNQLPEVESVKSLGTKSVKVVFSEPVRLPEQKNFELDGKVYFGKVTQPTSRTVILTPYNTAALAVGEHKLAITGVKDYANFVALTSTHDITVVEDTEAPTIVEATATLETITITFSEEVDPDTIKASNVYWTSGNTNKDTASFKALEDNKYKFTFNKDKSLPTGAVVIHVEGIKDYSGNQIAKGTTVTVNAEIDTTRPEVKKVEAVDKRIIDVKFSKVLLNATAIDVKNYTVTDKDGKVLPILKAERTGDNDVVRITLYKDLSAGDNTITIKNLKDNTRLENTMLDFTGKVNLADTSAPKLDSKLVNKSNRTVIVGFDKRMDAATLADYSNYHVTINNDRLPLTSDLADITVLQDSKAVAITFVESYKNQPVVFNSTTSTTQKNVQKLFVLGVKDEAGNLLKNFVDTTSATNEISLGSDSNVALSTYDSDYAGYSAALVGKDAIEVKFNAGIVSASTNAFTVYTSTGTKTVKEVELTGSSTVKLVLDSEVGTSAAGLRVDVNPNLLTTLAGVTTGVATQSTAVLDKVAPELKGDTSAYTNFALKSAGSNVIVVEFTESITLNSTALTTHGLAELFKVVRYSDTKTLKANEDYAVALGTDGKSIEITLNDSRPVDTEYIVSFGGTAFLTDASNVKNTVASFADKQTAKVGYSNVAVVSSIKGGTSVINLLNATPVDQQYTVEVKYADGTAAVGTSVWTVESVGGGVAPAGVAVDTNGLVTITPATATSGNFVLKVVTTVGGVSTTATRVVEVVKPAPVATSFTGLPTAPSLATNVAGNIDLSTGVSLLDQYGVAFVVPTGQSITWEKAADQADVAGITLTAAGVLSTDGNSQTGTYKVVAKYGTLTSSPVVVTFN